MPGNQPRFLSIGSRISLAYIVAVALCGCMPVSHLDTTPLAPPIKEIADATREVSAAMQSIARPSADSCLEDSRQTRSRITEVSTRLNVVEERLSKLPTRRKRSETTGLIAELRAELSMQIQLLREALPKGDPEPTKVVCDCSNPPTRGGDSAVPVTVNCSSESSSQGTGTGTGGSNAAREGTYDIGTTPINLVQNLYITPEKAREITEQEVRLLQWLLLLEERKVLEKDPDAECVPDEHRVQEFIAETRAALAAIQQGVASKDSRFEQGFTIATSTLASLEANLTKAPHLSMLVLGNVACLKAPLDWSWLKKGVTRLAQHAWLVLGAIWAWTAGLRATGRRFSSWAAGRRGDPGSPDYGLTRNGLTWNLTWAGLIAIGVLISIVNLSPYWRLALLLGNAQVAVNCFLLRPAKRAWKALSLERQAAQLAPLLDEIRRAADAGVAVKADLKLVTKRIDGLAAQKAGLKWGWFEAPPESKDLLHQRLMRLATVLSEQKRRAKALENSTP